MSTLTVRVCEECGTQSASADGWLVIAGFDIRSARTGALVTAIPAGTDLCSPGCLLRYVSRQLEPATNGHAAAYHQDDVPRSPAVKVA